MPETCALNEADFTAIPIVLKETWEAGFLENLEFVQGGLRLKAQKGYRRDSAFPSAGWNNVVAMAIDSCNQIYLLDHICDETGRLLGRLWRYDMKLETGESLPCLLPLNAPSGLAVSELNLFVSEEHRVLALSRENRQIRWIWEEANTDLADLAVHSDHLYILDKAGRRVILVGPDGKVIREFGQGILVSPQRMVLGRDDVIYLLDEGRIIRFDLQGNPITPNVDTQGLPASVVSLAADEDGDLYIGEGTPLTGSEETRRIYSHLPGVSGFVPLFGYTGPAFHIAFDHHKNIILVADGGMIVRLKLVISYPPQGSFLLLPLDSGMKNPNGYWHKLVLEGDRPAETTVAIRYRVDNHEKTVADLKAFPKSAWSAPLINFTDALLEAAGGRFLAIKGELATNNPSTTPSLRVLTAVFPRQSYLRYLPPIYQEDETSRAFLEKFLAIFETLLGKMSDQIDHTPKLIDPAATPRAFLSWLSGWLAFGLEEGWSELQQRQFLSKAMGLYKQRGTREGIAHGVKLITGKEPIIIEPFQLDCIEDACLREEYEQVYGHSDCHHFCLLLEPEAACPSEKTLTMVRRMVEEHIPAHTQGGVLGLRPWFRLGFQTYMGINTHLTQPVIRLEESVLGGGETGLTDSEEAGQVERKARLGFDITLT